MPSPLSPRTLTTVRIRSKRSSLRRALLASLTLAAGCTASSSGFANQPPAAAHLSPPRVPAAPARDSLAPDWPAPLQLPPPPSDQPLNLFAQRADSHWLTATPTAIQPATAVNDVGAVSNELSQLDVLGDSGLANGSSVLAEPWVEHWDEPFSQPWHLDFSPTPLPVPPLFHDSLSEQQVYDDKYPVPVQRPLVEWGRQFYGSGITPPSETWLGKTNLVQQQFLLYGDYRSGLSTGRNQAGRIDNWAQRINLDFDYRITATERFHAFVGPLNQANQFTHVAVQDGRLRYNEFYNLEPVTAFFEGDVGAMLGGATGQPSAREVPVTAGLVPLLFQNGIWMEDAVTAVAVAVPARHSRLLNWSNFDATLFAVFDQLNSPAFAADEHAAQAFGTAWFIDAYDGYIESGYAYVHDRKQLGRSYHNATFSFTRRYFDRISNSVRVITNSGQDLSKANRTADGVLLVVENSLVTAAPMNLIPYCNLFAGWDRPQSVARAGVSGGVLRNTGINFEIDGLNGHPTLDATAADSFGGAIGVDLIGDDFDRQWIIEAAYASPHGDRAFIRGDQFALGTRYQLALSHRTIIRLDAMHGWLEDDENIYGTRIEYRWKF